MENNMIPQLRFPEFDGGWNPVKLGSVATFSKGKGISKADITEDGATECIRYGELYTEYSEVITEIVSKTNIDKTELVLSEANDVIIPASGETQIDIATASCVAKSSVALGGDLNIIKSAIDGIFLSYYLNNAQKTNIARLSQGISVVHLYASQLKTLDIFVPIPEEQSKIATFLTSVDKRINLLQKKKVELERYKKGAMQKLFSVKTDGRPSLRFKQDDGNNFPDWEEKKLGEVGEIVNGLTYSPKDIHENGVLVLRSSNVHNRTLTFEDNVFVNANTYNKVKQNDILICVRNGSKRLIGKNTIIPKQYEGLAFGAFMAVYRSVNNEFLYHWFDTDNYKKEVHKNLGATINSINGSDLRHFKVPFPCYTEQQKIASFLSSIDKKIEKTGQQIEASQQWKQGLLQKMFV
jgi:type I restriction enzyme S subunit